MRPGKIAIYLRVSTRREDQEGGLATQLQACRQFLARQGLSADDVIVFQEQASGRKTDRPVLRKLLHEAALHHFGNVIVFKLDRLSRGGIVPTFHILKTLQDCGADVHSVSESWLRPEDPVHEVILAVLAFAAQIESASISERVSAGIARRRAEAERKGQPFLWGRARVSHLTRDPELPAKALRLRQDGLSWTRVAQTLGVGRTSARRLCHLAASSGAFRGGKSEAKPKGVPRAK